MEHRRCADVQYYFQTNSRRSSLAGTRNSAQGGEGRERESVFTLGRTKKLRTRRLVDLQRRAEVGGAL